MDNIRSGNSRRNPVPGQSQGMGKPVGTDICSHGPAARGRHFPRRGSQGVPFMVRVRAHKVPACGNIENIHVTAACHRNEPDRLQARQPEEFPAHGTGHTTAYGHHSGTERDRLRPGLRGIRVHALQGRAFGMDTVHDRDGHRAFHPHPDGIIIRLDAGTGRDSDPVHRP